VLVFLKVLSKYSSKLKENEISIVYGRISFREEEQPKLLLSDIYDVTEYSSRNTDTQNTVKTMQEAVPSKPKTVYLRFQHSDDVMINRISALLRLFSGNIPVHFYYQDTKQQLLVPESMYAQDGEYLKNKLIEFLGEPNVVYK